MKTLQEVIDIIRERLEVYKPNEHLPYDYTKGLSFGIIIAATQLYPQYYTEIYALWENEYRINYYQPE